jgi:capsular polysaccharide biosynthesis protein
MAVMGIGFVLAFLVGIGSALLAEHFDPSFRTPNEIVESLNIPVLASVPRRAA